MTERLCTFYLIHMPSQLHETLIEMVRNRPAVVADLLAGPLDVKVPPFEEALLSSGDLTEVVPTEFRADGVVTLQGTEGPTLAVVVEVQLRVDPRKRETWPVYFATVHARHRCPVSLLVLCPTPATAEWCAEPIRIGDPGMVLTPVVLGPLQVPLATDFTQIRHAPELALLSTLAHGGRDDPEPVLRTFVDARGVTSSGPGMPGGDHDHSGRGTHERPRGVPFPASPSSNQS